MNKKSFNLPFIIQTKTSSQKGQSFVETLIFTLTLTILVKLILLIFWIFTTTLWIEHQLYQALVCVAQQKKMSQCKHTALTQIKKLNVLGTINSLNFKIFQNKWKGELQWHFYKRNFLIKTNFKSSLNRRIKKIFLNNFFQKKKKDLQTQKKNFPFKKLFLLFMILQR